MGLINERHFEIEGFKMIEYQRKRRFIAGLASLSFFITASFCFGVLVQSKAGDTVFGFHISEDGPFSWLNLPFFEAKAESQEAYPYGNVTNNVLLVNFKDAGSWLTPEKLSTASSILNGEGTTLQSYIKEISYGKVNVSSILYGSDAHHSDGYVASYPLDYYITATSDKTEAMLEEELLKDIISQAAPDLGSKSIGELDTNQDGFLDNITFVIRGNKDMNHTLLWPHQYSIKNDGGGYPEIQTVDGSLKIKDYNVILSGNASQNEDQPGIFNANNSDLGVIAHEYLHVYGFPDMYHNYRYDEATGEYIPLTPDEQIGDPLGNWDIMDNTVPNLPQYPLVYTNMSYSPWHEKLPSLTTIDSSTKKVTLQKVTYGSDAQNIAAIIKVDPSINVLGESEYFMLEYRKKEFWDAGLPDSGLLVYRINTKANSTSDGIIDYCKTQPDGTINHCGNMFGPPDEVFIFRPNAADIVTGNTDSNTDRNLEQAALKSGGYGKSLELVSSYDPNQFNQTIYFSDGSNSGIVLSDITIAGDEISFQVEVPESIEDHTPPVIDEETGNGIKGNWTHVSPIISVHVSDAGHGIKELSVTTIDGELIGGSDAKTFTKSYSISDQVKNTNFEFKVKENGTYVVSATDFDGNTSQRNVKVEYIDTIAPTIDAGKITGTSSYYTMPVTFDDQGSGVKLDTAFYTTLGLKDATDNLVYDQPIQNGSIQLPSNFQGKVCITVKDIAGNSAKEPSCWVVSNDKNPPILSTTTNHKEDTWTADPLKVNVNAKDIVENDTGISYFEITTEDGTLASANAHHLVQDYGEKGGQEESFDFEVKSNGTYRIKVCDYASKCAEDTLTVKNIDLSAPVITEVQVENEKQLALFSTAAHKVRIVGHDEPVAANSGLREYRYQLVQEGDSYLADITSDVWKKAELDEEIHTDEDFTGTIYAYAIDNVGNVSKVFEKKIERVSNSLVNDALKTGIKDASNKVNIIGISDPDVTMELKDVDMEGIKAKIGEDYLSTNVLQNVYDIALLKAGSAYSLSDEVTIRLTIDEALQKDGSLRVIALDENGNISEVASSLGEGYIEFKTSTMSLFATVTSLKTETDVNAKDAIVNEAGPQTGDETTIALYIVGMLSTIAGISFLTHRRRLDDFS